MDEPTVLVTNDDGIHSPGLKAAVAAVTCFGKTVVVAPTKQGTSMGRCLRGDRNETLHPIDFVVNGQNIPAYHCDASPAMVVKHGMAVLFATHKPDLVVAGINYGENVGVHVTHSGTIGAAQQACAYGVPALAASLQTQTKYHFAYGDLDWSAAIHFVRHLAEYLLNNPLPADVDILNLNVPDSATPQTRWVTTRLARQAYYKSTLPDPRLDSKIGDAQLTVEVDHTILEPDSDIKALVVDRLVSVTPLSLDLTSRIDLQAFDRTHLNER